MLLSLHSTRWLESWMLLDVAWFSMWIHDPSTGFFPSPFLSCPLTCRNSSRCRFRVPSPTQNWSKAHCTDEASTCSWGGRKGWPQKGRLHKSQVVVVYIYTHMQDRRFGERISNLWMCCSSKNDRKDNWVWPWSANILGVLVDLPLNQVGAFPGSLGAGEQLPKQHHFMSHHEVPDTSLLITTFPRGQTLPKSIKSQLINIRTYSLILRTSGFVQQWSHIWKNRENETILV